MRSLQEQVSVDPVLPKILKLLNGKTHSQAYNLLSDAQNCIDKIANINTADEKKLLADLEKIVTAD